MFSWFSSTSSAINVLLSLLHDGSSSTSSILSGWRQIRTSTSEHDSNDGGDAEGRNRSDGDGGGGENVFLPSGSMMHLATAQQYYAQGFSRRYAV